MSKVTELYKLYARVLGCREKRAEIALSLRNKEETGSFCRLAGQTEIERAQ